LNLECRETLPLPLFGQIFESVDSCLDASTHHCDAESSNQLGPARQSEREGYPCTYIENKSAMEVHLMKLADVSIAPLQ